MVPSTGSFHDFMVGRRAAGELVVQPRMGFSDPAQMRAGLLATRMARGTTAGTLTLDSFTRTGDFESAAAALAAGRTLNGYPIVNHPVATTRRVLAGVRDATFPVQVRHGAAVPGRIFDAIVAAGLDATEGGPISYCLPYSRLPIRHAVTEWARSCRRLARLRDHGLEPHVESFGGCMLGQLCPPSLLIAITVLEAMFFRQHGLRSVSLSYAQQTSHVQDEEAVGALQAIAADRLGDIDWHVVLYTCMGMFPASAAGAQRLISDAAAMAVRTGADRLIVKTVAEANRIPTIAENVHALETAADAARAARRRAAPPADSGIRAESDALIDSVLDLDPDVGRGLTQAFTRGLLDVPYCLHPDNAGRTASYIDDDGWLRWSSVGALRIDQDHRVSRSPRLSSAQLLLALSYVQRRYDD